MVTTVAPFTKSFATIVNDFVAMAQSQSNVPLDFTEGSVFLAWAEATGGNVDWLQKLYLFALTVQRLQSSFGPWVDTFTADFMPPVAGTTSPRLPAVGASGLVTFSRAAPQAQAVVPVGTLVATFDGSIVFTVTADTTNVNYNPTIIPGGGYVLAGGVASIQVPVAALNPGDVGNVVAGTITQIRSTIVGVDAVTNAAPFINGLGQETDVQLKLRFPLFIASLQKATEGAIGYAVVSMQQGLQYKIHENIDPNGAADLGMVTVFIDDGSGSPPPSLVTNVAANIALYRAAGVRVSVVGATVLTVNVSMITTTAAGYNHTFVVAAVQNAVAAFVNNLGLEATLPWSELAHIAYNASPGVVNVTSVTANGGTADIVPALGKTIKIGTCTVA